MNPESVWYLIDNESNRIVYKSNSLKDVLEYAKEKGYPTHFYIAPGTALETASADDDLLPDVQYLEVDEVKILKIVKERRQDGYVYRIYHGEDFSIESGIARRRKDGSWWVSYTGPYDSLESIIKLIGLNVLVLQRRIALHHGETVEDVEWALEKVKKAKIV